MAVDKLVDSTQLDSDLTSVANAIRTKGGTSGSLSFPSGFVSAVQAIPTGITPTGTIQITENGTVDVTNYASANVNVSGGGGNPEADENDVVFIDYDGTIRYSYSASDFANLTELPANPSHDGLTAQGWNWTLADAKTYVAANKGLIIGQSYTTNDGKSRLYIELQARRTLPLRFYQSDSNGVSIDWGDGSTAETLSGAGLKSTTHTYSNPGSYVISLNVTTGTMYFGGNNTSYCVFGASGSGNTTNNANRVYVTALKKVEIGNNVTMVGKYAFQYCFSLQSISIPISVKTISDYAFQYCCSIRGIVIPKWTSNGYPEIKGSAHRDMYSLRIISISQTVNDIGGTQFYNSYSLREIYFPYVTNIRSSVINANYNLSKIIVPNSVTSIESSAFAGCVGAKEYHIKPTTPPTLTNANTFTNIPSDCVIYVPSASLTTYQSASIWSDYASKMVGE